MPNSARYLHVSDWWMTWRRLSNECDLRPVDWVQLFNVAMNYKNLYSRFLKEVIEFEVVEGRG